MTLDKLLTNEHGVNYAEWLKEIADEDFNAVPVTTRQLASVLDAQISAQIAQVPDSQCAATTGRQVQSGAVSQNDRAAELSVS